MVCVGVICYRTGRLPGDVIPFLARIRLDPGGMRVHGAFGTVAGPLSFRSSRSLSVSDRNQTSE